MADPMTMELARRLAAQDSPLPALAGSALNLLFERIEFLERAMRAGAKVLEADGDEHGVAAALRIALNERPRLIGVDHAAGDDETTVCVASERANGHLHVEQIVHWPRHAGRTSAQLAAIQAALRLYPSRNQHQLQAAKVCEGVLRLAQKLRDEGLRKSGLGPENAHG